MSLRESAGFNNPVFQSRKKGHLHPSQVMRIVRAAAQRAGIDANVSPHWLRHAHASHSLDRGHRFTWYRRHWDTLVLQQLVDISMRDLKTVRQGIWS